MNRRKVAVIRSAKSLDELTLDEIAEHEENNRKASAERQLPELDFVRRLRVLYERRGLHSAVPDSLMVPFFLFNDAGRSLIISTLMMMRGHQSECFAVLRRAIEAASYGYSARNVTNANIWLKRKSNDPEFWREFQNKKKRFPAEVPEFVELKRCWETTCNAGSHSTFLSLAARTGVKEKIASFGYFDLDQDPDVDICRGLNFVVFTHVYILGVFQRILGKVLSEKWANDFAELRRDQERYANQVLRKRFEDSEKNPPVVEEKTPAGIIIPRPGALTELLLAGGAPKQFRKPGRPANG